MALFQLGAVVVATGALLAPSHPAELGVHRVARSIAPGHYAASQTEHYLTAEQIAYVRPGLHITVGSVQIGQDLKPLADITFTDDAGQPLDRAGVLTPGALSISFILDWYDPAARHYTDYYTSTQTSPITGVSAQQATTASGTWEDLGTGHARFHFTKALPANYDATKTHTLGIYATRVIDLTDPIVINKTYVTNVEYDFRPDGQPVTDTWDKIATATCNQCHDPLAAHGETGRQDIKLCVLCHNPQTVDPDTGNSVDAKVMIHKIHMGSSLPSVKAGGHYEIIGYRQSVQDFSDVVFPQDIRNCTTCHKPSSPQGFVWYTYPSRAACGSCHDDIDWTTGDNHPGGAQADDSACASCHQPQGEAEWDASIINAHTVPTKSQQLPGVNLEILDVTGATPGGKPTVTFKLTNNGGTPLDPSTLASFNFLLGGPTTDYTTTISESGKSATASGGAWMYTFNTPLPGDAVGTWTLSADAYNNVTLDPAPRLGPTSVRDAAQNPIFDVAVTDAQPMARRVVADINKCNVCHDVLALHGGQRFKVQECVICHNPDNNDATYRPADQAPPETIHFDYLVHRIHTGENQSFPYIIYGYHGSVNDFSDVRFPGDRRDCLKCHADVASGQQTFELPLPEDALPTPTLRNPYLQEMQPTAAACLACHDERDAAAHAATMTTSFGEACVVCHGPDADFSVAKVHAR
jgi:OmcA/MtrC family decaheme c-type cytochrome